jgi:hypothetical protein
MTHHREASALCIRECGRPRRPGQRECNTCHAETMRAHRERHVREIDQLKAELARLRQENQVLREEIEVHL